MGRLNMGKMLRGMQLETIGGLPCPDTRVKLRRHPRWRLLRWPHVLEDKNLPLTSQELSYAQLWPCLALQDARTVGLSLRGKLNDKTSKSSTGNTVGKLLVNCRIPCAVVHPIQLFSSMSLAFALDPFGLMLPGPSNILPSASAASWLLYRPLCKQLVGPYWDRARFNRRVKVQDPLPKSHLVRRKGSRF